MRRISKSRQIKLLLLDLEVQEIKNEKLESENQKLKTTLASKNICLVGIIKVNVKLTNKINEIKNLLGGM